MGVPGLRECSLSLMRFVRNKGIPLYALRPSARSGSPPWRPHECDDGRRGSVIPWVWEYSECRCRAIATADAQTADAVLMVRPASFGWNPQTQASNRFQRDEPGLAGASNERARAEFDALALQLRAAGIAVSVAADVPSAGRARTPFFRTTG